MRKLLIAAALVSTAMATPALARDGSIYVGLDAGVVRPDSLKLDFDNGTSIRDGLSLRHKWGFDVDGVGGYDFGMFRLEGEIGYKRAKIKSADADRAVLTAVRPNNLGVLSFDSTGHTDVFSAMLNGLIDLGPQDGVNLSLGAGVGLARTRVVADLTPSTALNFRSDDRSMAWQLLAALRVPVSSNVDLGVEGRHFETSRVHFGTFCETTCPSITPFDLKGRYKSNSVLFSARYNFYSAPPPPPPPPAPPPPPPPPATQTCPDGSVIPVTTTCPAPPPPPPPPPPAPERG